MLKLIDIEKIGIILERFCPRGELKPALEFLSKQGPFQAEITKNYQPEREDGMLLGIYEHLKTIQQICHDDK